MIDLKTATARKAAELAPASAAVNGGRHTAASGVASAATAAAPPPTTATTLASCSSLVPMVLLYEFVAQAQCLVDRAGLMVSSGSKGERPATPSPTAVAPLVAAPHAPHPPPPPPTTKKQDAAALVAQLDEDPALERALLGVRAAAASDPRAAVARLVEWRQAVSDAAKRPAPAAGGGASATVAATTTTTTTTPEGVAQRAAAEVLFLEAAAQVIVASGARPRGGRRRASAAGGDDGAGPSSTTIASFRESMLHVAFRWALHAHEYVPATAPSRLPGGAAPRCLAPLRARVVRSAERLVGLLSETGAADAAAPSSTAPLADITRYFARKLDERLSPGSAAAAGTTSSAARGLLSSLSAAAAPDTPQAAAARAAAFRLAGAMRDVRLSFTCDADAEQAADALRRLHPLSRQAARRRSRVHHSMAALLSRLLVPLARNDAPRTALAVGLLSSPAALEGWQKEVSRIKADVGAWVNKHAKHAATGYPLITALVCLASSSSSAPASAAAPSSSSGAERQQQQQQEQADAHMVDAMADFLLKQVGGAPQQPGGGGAGGAAGEAAAAAAVADDATRALCLRCVGLLAVNRLSRASVQVKTAAALDDPMERADAWLDRFLRPALLAAAAALPASTAAAAASAKAAAQGAPPPPRQALSLPAASAPAFMSHPLWRALLDVLTDVARVRPSYAFSRLAPGLLLPAAAGGGGGGAPSARSPSPPEAQLACAMALARALVGSGPEAACVAAAAEATEDDDDDEASAASASASPGLVPALAALERTAHLLAARDDPDYAVAPAPLAPGDDGGGPGNGTFLSPWARDEQGPPAALPLPPATMLVFASAGRSSLRADLARGLLPSVTHAIEALVATTTTTATPSAAAAPCAHAALLAVLLDLSPLLLAAAEARNYDDAAQEEEEHADDANNNNRWRLLDLAAACVSQEAPAVRRSAVAALAACALGAPDLRRAALERAAQLAAAPSMTDAGVSRAALRLCARLARAWSRLEEEAARAVAAGGDDGRVVACSSAPTRARLLADSSDDVAVRRLQPPPPLRPAPASGALLAQVEGALLSGLCRRDRRARALALRALEAVRDLRRASTAVQDACSLADALEDAADEALREGRWDPVGDGAAGLAAPATATTTTTATPLRLLEQELLLLAPPSPPGETCQTDLRWLRALSVLCRRLPGLGCREAAAAAGACVRARLGRALASSSSSSSSIAGVGASAAASSSSSGLTPMALYLATATAPAGVDDDVSALLVAACALPTSAAAVAGRQHHQPGASAVAPRALFPALLGNLSVDGSAVHRRAAALALAGACGPYLEALVGGGEAGGGGGLLLDLSSTLGLLPAPSSGGGGGGGEAGSGGGPAGGEDPPPALAAVGDVLRLALAWRGRGGEGEEDDDDEEDKQQRQEDGLSACASAWLSAARSWLAARTQDSSSASSLPRAGSPAHLAACVGAVLAAGAAAAASGKPLLPTAAADGATPLFLELVSWTPESDAVFNCGDSSSSSYRARLERSAEQAASTAAAAAAASAAADAEAAAAALAARERARISADALAHASRDGLAAVLRLAAREGAATLDRPPVMAWLRRLLQREQQEGAPAAASSTTAARSALSALLSAGAWREVLEGAYDPLPRVSAAHFGALVEAYALLPAAAVATSAEPAPSSLPPPPPPPILLALVLAKMVDPSPEVREDALFLLRVLSEREWRAQGDDDDERSGGGTAALPPPPAPPQTVVVLGRLPETYAPFQYELSAKLAREHPHLAAAVLEEALCRMLARDEAEAAGLPPPPPPAAMLAALAPWAEALDLAGDPEADRRVVSLLLRATRRFAARAPGETERIWGALAVPGGGGDGGGASGAAAAAASSSGALLIPPPLPASNALLAVDALLSEVQAAGARPGDAELDATLCAAERAALFLARAAPRPTLDALALEAAAVAGGGGGGSGGDDDDDDDEHVAARRPFTLGGLLLTRGITDGENHQRQQPDATTSAAATRPSRPPLPRAAAALALLAEPAYEHDEDLAAHAAGLLHGALVSCDARREPCARRARRLLLHLAYSLLARQHHDGLSSAPTGDDDGDYDESRGAEPTAMPPSQELLRSLLAVAQGPCPWPRETPTPERPDPPSSAAVGALALRMSRVLGPAVASAAAEAGATATRTGGPATTAAAAASSSAPDVVESPDLPHPAPSLSASWADVALDWALRAPSRHASARSLAALRALAPRPTLSVTSALLQSLARCHSSSSAAAASSATAACLALTLEALVAALPDEGLLLQPAAFWGAAALLASPRATAAEFCAAAGVVGRFVRALPLHDATVQNVLLAMAPVADGGGGGGGSGGGSSSAAAAASADEQQQQQEGARAARGVAVAALLLPPPHLLGAIDPRGSLAALALRPDVSLDLSAAAAAAATAAATAGLQAGGQPPLLPPPRPWAMAEHLLPPCLSGGGGADSASQPPSQVLAIQQLLWKGLLLRPSAAGGGGSGTHDARSAALRLATQLAAQLAQLAPAQRRLVAATAALGRRQALPPPLLPRQSSCSSLRASAGGGGGVRRSMAAGAAATTGARRQPTAAGGDALTRSAPELRPALMLRGGARHHHGRARYHHGRTRSSLGALAEAAAAGASASSSSLFRRQRGAAWPAVLSSSSSSSARRPPPGSRHVFQALLGHRHAQVLATAMGVAPVFAEELLLLGWDEGQEAEGRRRQHGAAAETATAAAARECLAVLAAACDAQGLPAVSRALARLARVQPPPGGGGGSVALAEEDAPARALAALGAALARALFPRHAAWVLQVAAEMLSMDGAPGIRGPVLAMLAGALRAVVGGGRGREEGDEEDEDDDEEDAPVVLSPEAATMLTDAQGPLMARVARMARDEALLVPALAVLEAAMAATAAAGGGPGGSEQPIPSSLVLPEGDTARALWRVLAASSRRGALAQLRRREQALLPFLSARGPAPGRR
jgi:hypothetical protein